MDAKRQKYLCTVKRTKKITIKDETCNVDDMIQFVKSFLPRHENCFTVMVNPKDTIGAVKAYIQEEKGIPFKKQNLLLSDDGGGNLSDAYTLDSLGISTLILRYAMQIPSAVKMLMLSFIVKDPWSLTRTMQIVIHDDTYKDVIKFRAVSESLTPQFGPEGTFDIKDCRHSYTLMVEPDDTIAAVKAYIQEQTGFYFNKQKLVKEDGEDSAVLRNDQILSSLGIKKGSSLILRYAGVFKIPFRHRRTGSIVKLSINPGDTVGDVKAALKEKMRVEIKLAYRGQILPDDQRLNVLWRIVELK